VAAEEHVGAENPLAPAEKSQTPTPHDHERLEFSEPWHYQDWETERNYIREDKALGSLDKLHELLAQEPN